MLNFVDVDGWPLFVQGNVLSQSMTPLVVKPYTITVVLLKML